MIAAKITNARTTGTNSAAGDAETSAVTVRLNRTKVIIDFLAALLLMIPAVPLILMAMILVRLTSKGPLIYTQTRVGHGGRLFTIFKIRTMHDNCEQVTGACWSVGNDPRITAVGLFLRRTHLDELPQLVNVLRGEMSLVGPRPERPEFVGQLEAVLPRYRERVAVRPGVTGLAQIQLPPDTDLTSVRRKLTCDLHYIEKMNLWLDLRITVCTALGLLGIPHATSCRVLGLPRLNEFSWAPTRVQTS
ncbi:sugar transferase [Singulisphaera acidiphila]|uniref:sugar transferase n=1 Tax=Singulisphaera acidiphila TaxID=466153 RepID=UPI00024744FF|nr:sugar transferase [Singulisphaera acidiphila]